MASRCKQLVVAGLIKTAAAHDHTVKEALKKSVALAARGPSSVLRVVHHAGGPQWNPFSHNDHVTPVVMMHGMGDFGTNPMGMLVTKEHIASLTRGYVTSVELCSNPEQLSDCADEDQWNGFLMTMDAQVDQFARVVRADPKLKDGFNAVGYSQGNLVLRGYVSRYNEPPVRTWLSFHGPLMGVARLPDCPVDESALGVLCRSVNALADKGVYVGFVQDRLAQANYFRNTEDLRDYHKYCHFLPDINNEVRGHENQTYKANFEKLHNLVLVMAEEDQMVQPKESEHFGFYKDGSMSEVVAMRDSEWYKENWFGLRTLDEAGKIHMYSTPGDHLRIKSDFMMRMVEEYFIARSDVKLV